MRSNGYDDSREISREISPEISREISREIASASGHRLEVRSTAASGQGVYAREPLAAHAAIVAEAPVTVPLESSSERCLPRAHALDLLMRTLVEGARAGNETFETLLRGPARMSYLQKHLGESKK